MLVVVSWFAPVQAGAVPRSFVPGSLAEIKQAHQGKPFMLKMWSIDCRPCVKDLEMLAKELKAHPALTLVLVSVDESASLPQVDATLARVGMAGIESWIFADGDARRLRGEIDPSWYGELPRTYFYDAAHHRISLTGALTADHIAAWLESVAH